MYSLTLATIPPIAWFEPEIIALGAEQSAINGEVPNITITIDNARGQNTVPVVASSILRVRAEVRDGDRLVFAGAVQAVTLGPELIIELES